MSSEEKKHAQLMTYLQYIIIIKINLQKLLFAANYKKKHLLKHYIHTEEWLLHKKQEYLNRKRNNINSICVNQISVPTNIF